MTGTRRRIALVTESPMPSGVGEHLLTLADGLAERYDIVIGAPRDTALIAAARARGLPVKIVDPERPEDIRRWLDRARSRNTN